MEPALLSLWFLQAPALPAIWVKFREFPVFAFLMFFEARKRGWMESQSGRPAGYRTRPPSEALRLVRIKQEVLLVLGSGGRVFGNMVGRSWPGRVC